MVFHDSSLLAHLPSQTSCTASAQKNTTPILGDVTQTYGSLWESFLCGRSYWIEGGGSAGLHILQYTPKFCNDSSKGALAVAGGAGVTGRCVLPSFLSLILSLGRRRPLRFFCLCNSAPPIMSFGVPPSLLPPARLLEAEAARFNSAEMQTFFPRQGGRGRRNLRFRLED